MVMSDFSILDMMKKEKPDLYNAAESLLRSCGPDVVNAASVAYAAPEMLIAKLMVKVN
jgi:hypothetical protein